jgi:hypothetical protein
MRSALLALSLLLIIARNAHAPELSNYGYVVRIMYIADLPTIYEKRADCAVQEAMIENLRDTPAIRDGLTRVVLCMPVGR